MSTLAQVYSLGCGMPLTRPEIADVFFPTAHPLDKTILIHAFAGATLNNNGQLQAAFPAKIYDYFNEVIDLLKPIVEPLGYKIIQIGGPNEPGLRGIESLAGATTMHQCAYLVKNAALLIGNDSMWAHVAGAYGRAQVHVYGSTSKPHFPYWNNHLKSSFIESHRRGQKPSYSAHENPKSINWIPPEKIVCDALSILGCGPHPTRKSIYIGEVYNNPCLEVVPNMVVGPQVQSTSPLVFRMDIEHNEQILANNLQNRKGLIMTKKEIDLGLLQTFKKNIASMRVEVDEVNPAWIKGVKKLGLQAGFFSTERDQEKLATLRLNLFDAFNGGGFDKFTPPTVEDFYKSAAVYLNKELDKDFKLEKLKFKSNKFFLSDNKVYLSKAHLTAKQHVASSEENVGFVINTPEFWEEQAHYYFFTE